MSKEYPCETCISHLLGMFSICATTCVDVNPETGICKYYEEATEENKKKYF